MNNICVVGDSLAKGVILDTVREKYFFLKDSFVNLFSQKNKVDVANYSKFGCTIEGGLTAVERHAEQIAASDFTVVEFGGNDSDFDWAGISEHPDEEHACRTPLAVFTTCYHQVIGKIKELGAKPVILNLPPVDARRYFAWISRGRSPENILKWLGGDEEYIYRWHEMYNLRVCAVAAEEKVPLVDIRSEFLARRDYCQLLCDDGIHPNGAGHALIYETLEQVLTEGYPQLV